MSFLAQCQFCGQKVKVPDHALGASGRCPKCAAFFTLAPADDDLAPARATPLAAVQPASAAPAPCRQPDTEPALRDTRTRLEPGPDETPPPSPEAAESSEMRIAELAVGRGKPRWTQFPGPAALLLAGVGLLCASSSWLSRLVVPLAVLGLLLGGVGLLYLHSLSLVRRLYPIIGTAAAGLLLLLALFFPAALGPTYLASTARDVVDRTSIQVIPLSGSSLAAGPQGLNGVDASQAALQQGPVHLQVIGASIRPVEPRAPAKETDPVQECLHIRVRCRQTIEAAAFAKDRKEPPKDNPRPMPAARLTDAAGKALSQREVREAPPGKSERRAFPLVVTDYDCVFEAPAAEAVGLRLEMPASSWGGSGVFRFVIPGSMIVREQLDPARSTFRPGGP